jgi:hypothetical protein
LLLFALLVRARPRDSAVTGPSMSEVFMNGTALHIELI